VIAAMPLVGVTLRGLLDRRRTWLMLGLVSLPVLIALVLRVAGGRAGAPQVLDTLLIRTVMPLVALVFGTAALGSELEDGTAVYLMVKPIPRWRILAAKLAVAAGLTVALVVPSAVATALVRAGLTPASVEIAVGFGIAIALGATAYASVFVTLSAFTTRALVIGLVYVLIWEGILAGLFEGVRFLSIRQATLGVASALSGRDPGLPPLDPIASLTILGAALLGAIALGTWRLARFEVRGD
jgi:ABC-2 type transport system permease protein